MRSFLFTSTRLFGWSVVLLVMFVAVAVNGSSIDLKCITASSTAITLSGTCKQKTVTFAIPSEKFKFHMTYTDYNEIAKTVKLSIGECKLEGGLTVIPGKRPFWTIQGDSEVSLRFPIDGDYSDGVLHLSGKYSTSKTCNPFGKSKSGNVVAVVDYTAGDFLPALSIKFIDVDLSSDEPVKGADWGIRGYLLWTTIVGGIAFAVVAITSGVGWWRYKVKKEEKANMTVNTQKASDLPVDPPSNRSGKMKHKDEKSKFPASGNEVMEAKKPEEQAIKNKDDQAYKNVKPKRTSIKSQPKTGDLNEQNLMSSAPGAITKQSMTVEMTARDDTKKDVGQLSRSFGNREQTDVTQRSLANGENQETATQTIGGPSTSKGGSMTTGDGEAITPSLFEGKTWNWPSTVQTPDEDDFTEEQRNVFMSFNLNVNNTARIDQFLLAFPISTKIHLRVLRNTITTLSMGESTAEEDKIKAVLEYINAKTIMASLPSG